MLLIFPLSPERRIASFGQTEEKEKYPSECGRVIMDWCGKEFQKEIEYSQHVGEKNKTIS